MKKILIIDDTPEYIEMLEDVLLEYEVHGATDGKSGIELARKILPDTILLDINMPGLNGYEVCRRLKKEPLLKTIPVIFLTANEGCDFEEIGFEVGAVDYVSKPFNATLLKARLKTHVHLYALQSNLQQEVNSRVKEISKLNTEMILVTASIAELKSKETGLHIKRVSKLSGKLALYLGLSTHEVEMIEMAAVLHDIGKVGIPDSILNKSTSLDNDEWTMMKTHSKLGYNILSKSEFSLMRYAAKIALEHHERWDGSGYPNGLKAHEISYAGRVVAVADVFDSLLDVRVYKEAWSSQKVKKYFEDMKGTQFDPEITQVLLENFEEFLDTRLL
jgi:putative two-component system response regulator